MTISVFPGSIPQLGIQLDSPEWFEWLAAQSQFKYEGNLTAMSVKRRASNGKWYARKKVYSSDKGSVPIDLYIGSDEECSSEKLKEINYRFGQDWRDFWSWYHSPARKESKAKGVQREEVYTEQPQLSQTRDETEELRARIAELEQSNSELQSANQALEKHLSECSLQLKEALSEINELLFTKSQVEQKDDYIRELQGELLSRPRPSDLIRRKIAELGMQEKIMQHQRDPKTNARYWALAKLLEALE
jgi:regulator of replication initiation timing